MLADGLRLWRGTVLADFPDEHVPAGRAGPAGGAAAGGPGGPGHRGTRAGPPRGRGGRARAAGRRPPVPRGSARAADARAVPLAAGRAEALQALQAADRALRDELGIDPSPDLRQLQRQILQQSPELNWSPARAPVDLRPGRGRVSPSAVGAAVELVGRATTARRAAGRAGPDRRRARTGGAADGRAGDRQDAAGRRGHAAGAARRVAFAGSPAGDRPAESGRAGRAVAKQRSGRRRCASSR